MKQQIIEILNKYTHDLELHGYFGGKVQEKVADEIMAITGGYLGYVNDFSEDKPKIFHNCKHVHREYKTELMFEHLYTCEECGFWYKVDTSG